MYDPVDSCGMPLQIADSAPRFAGDYTQLVNFLESVERLAQPLGLTDKEIIKYALKYTAPKQRQLLSYYEGDNYVEFADHVLYFYLECGVDHYMRPIFEKPAAIKAPLASAPPQPERAQEQPVAEPIAPVPEICDAIFPPVVPEVPLDITPPPSVQLEAHIISAPQEPISTPQYPLAEDIPPQLEVCEPITIPILPEAPLEEIIPPSVSDDSKDLLHISAPVPEPSEVSEVQYTPLSNQVQSLETPSVADTSALVAFSAHSDQNPQVQYPCTIPPSVSDDFKHPSHLNAPVMESSAVPEAQYAPLSDQVKSLVTPSVTDHSALFAFSTYSDYHLPVKHPCIASPIRQLDHVLDDSEAPPVRHHTPEVAQVTQVEALYIHPCTSSHFSSISCLKLSRSHTPVAFISLSSPHHFIVNSSFMRRIRTPRALFPVPYAPVIAEEFSCYHIPTISSVLNHTFITRNQSHFKLPSTRNLCAHLAYIRTPFAIIIVLDSTFCAAILMFRIFAYFVDIIFACPIKGYLFMSWRQLALDLESIRRHRALFTPIINYHLRCVNIFTVYQPLLSYPEDIDSNAPKRECVRSSCAHYLTIEHPHAPYIAPLGHAFNLYRKVQEFIPPVTSPPSSRV
ncbi:hypothetical protein F4604DRAFT_1932701 [Suillus subluteus]|nr:hypothetical protein F4604DRAFT_1932701 [Suillus subluteus]